MHQVITILYMVFVCYMVSEFSTSISEWSKLLLNKQYIISPSLWIQMRKWVVIPFWCSRWRNSDISCTAPLCTNEEEYFSLNRNWRQNWGILFVMASQKVNKHISVSSFWCFSQYPFFNYAESEDGADNSVFCQAEEAGCNSRVGNGQTPGAVWKATRWMRHRWVSNRPVRHK